MLLWGEISGVKLPIIIVGVKIGSSNLKSYGGDLQQCYCGGEDWEQCYCAPFHKG